MGSPPPSREAEAPTPALHGAFTVERRLPAPPEQVFRAYAELELRRRWFRIPGPDATHTLDLRTGGSELMRGTFAPSGVDEHVEVRLRFLEVVPERRIVASQELLLDERLRSVSQVTIELTREGDGTLLRHTEQYAILIPTGDGSADASERRGGTQLSLNGLQALVEDGFPAR